MRYEFFDHTADIGVRAYGNSLKEMFKNAALASFDVMIESNEAEPNRTLNVEVREETGDLERLLGQLNQDYGLENLRIDYLTLKQLPDRVRESKWKVTVAVWKDKEIIRILPGKIGDYYGMAIDVGTTTVAAYFCNLATMEVIDTVSMMNPQCKYGEDVMSRITYHMTHEDGLDKMSGDIIEALNTLVAQACEGTHPPKKKKGKHNQEAQTDNEAPEDQEDKHYLCLARMISLT